MTIPNEIDYYRAEYLRIASEVSKVYPECEVATLDMVRLLIHEVDTLRMALGIPTRRTVLNKLENETEICD
jgi:hypothetical protein